MDSIKDLSVSYDAINDSNTFTSGDFISGRVNLTVSKHTKINSFSIKAKGKASVQWTEHYGQHSTVVYHDKETCFKSVQFFVQEQEGRGGDGYALLSNESGRSYPSEVAPGCHTYPFTFQIPQENMPASFKGAHGKVVYFLEAKLCRSMRMSSKAKIKFNYVPKPDLTIPSLMLPICEDLTKKMKLFTSGSVSMEVKLEKMGYHIGEDLKFEVYITNKCSRTIAPKYSLYQKQSFFAMKRRRVHTEQLLKEEGERIEPAGARSVTKVLKIPPTTASIFNCRVLKVEYRLKVHLDIPLASDPEIKLPVVILPVSPDAGTISHPDIHIGFEWSGGSNPANQTEWNATFSASSGPSNLMFGTYTSESLS
ncbi:arrestin domain-containing protein 3-like [Chanos chanos]|uniref:Arrestin domain-containing protein 3-like n=1 Tax=Chanos chanos TaxID=29144 RepID=A0A6J2WTY1_CHACN|nr:arrestin domain-containing protein 3-like [Chanos chanos]